MKLVDSTSQRIDVQGNANVLAKVLSELFVELEVAFDGDETAASSTIDVHRFGDFELLRTRLYEGRFAAVRSEALVRRSSYNHFFIAFVMDGEVGLAQSGRQIDLQASEFALLDSTHGYEVHAKGAHDVLWIRVPRYRLEGRLPFPMAVTAQKIDGSEGAGRVVSNMLMTLREEVERIGHAKALRISNTLLDLLALCLETPSEQAGTRSDMVLRRIQNYIEAHICDTDLTLERIADRQAVSVRYLNKLFEREGVSTAKWIRMRRLERCRREIESPEFLHRPISDIAYANGFNDASTFNRAFKAHFGVTPTSLRNLH